MKISVISENGPSLWTVRAFNFLTTQHRVADWNQHGTWYGAHNVTCWIQNPAKRQRSPRHSPALIKISRARHARWRKHAALLQACNDDVLLPHYVQSVQLQPRLLKVGFVLIRPQPYKPETSTSDVIKNSFLGENKIKNAKKTELNKVKCMNWTEQIISRSCNTPQPCKIIRYVIAVILLLRNFLVLKRSWRTAFALTCMIMRDRRVI